MTKLEKRVLNKILENMKSPSATATTYDENFHRTGGVGHDEAIRRLDSADYKLGWEKCWEEFKQRLDFLMNSDPKDQQKYAGRG